MRALLRSDGEITEIYKRNAQAVFRVCALFFRGNVKDAEDAVQSTFLKLMKDGTPFCSAEHERAWLIVTASNVCRDVLRSGWRRRVDMDQAALEQKAAPEYRDETFQSLAALPDKYKTAIYMHYYEGYSCREIAGYMGRSEASVWRYLRQGRDILRQLLREEGEGNEE